MSIHRPALIQTIRSVGCRRRQEPVRLSDGSYTHHYLDVKGVLDTGQRMQLAALAMMDWLDELELEYNAIGGPTMGADVISHAVVARRPFVQWFSVRDPKTTHGLGRVIEGAVLGYGHEVILTDDVVNSGDSLVDSYNKVVATGAHVVAVVPLVDRGGKAAWRFGIREVPYHPLITHEDLRIAAL